MLFAWDSPPLGCTWHGLGVGIPCWSAYSFAPTFRLIRVLLQLSKARWNFGEKGLALKAAAH